MEIGVCTFGDITTDAQQSLRDMIEQAELAEQVGLDVFAVGEHHRPDFSVSAPAVVLGAIAARTQRIRLTTGVTVLSSEDPVRVWEQFATIDLISGGRAEIIAGRGSFTESFSLFGFDTADYDELFAEKLGLLLQLREGGPIQWQGKFRAPLAERGVWPAPAQVRLPIWIGVGGNPPSAERAGRLGLPMTIAIIGGQPERFVPFAQIHTEAARLAGHPEPLPLAINTHAYLADTPKQAADEYFPHYAGMMSRIGRERGWSPMTRPQFDALTTPRGALAVGSPEQVAEKILFQHSLFGHQRYLAQISVGTLPQAKALRAIELLGTKVAPLVHDEVARREATGGAVA